MPTLIKKLSQACENQVIVVIALVTNCMLTCEKKSASLYPVQHCNVLAAVTSYAGQHEDTQPAASSQTSSQAATAKHFSRAQETLDCNDRDSCGSTTCPRGEAEQTAQCNDSGNRRSDGREQLATDAGQTGSTATSTSHRQRSRAVI